MKLSGRKRIGIIASVVWIIVAGPYVYFSSWDKASKWIASDHVRCDNDLAGLPPDAHQKGFDCAIKLPMIGLRSWSLIFGSKRRLLLSFRSS
jgi:hypothetical protein